MKTKTILGALAAVTLLAGVAAAQPAEAGWYHWHYYHWHYHWWHH